jgi:membrane fusion protein (multidrug efflux system)
MAADFSQSMRALAADRGQWAVSGLVLVLVFLVVWGVWFGRARIAVYAVTQTARLEVDQAGHPIATPVAGRMVETHLVVGRQVQAGEVLVKLDASAARLQHEEARVGLNALKSQRQARQEEMNAEKRAREDEQHAARIALAEAAARHREANVAAQAAIKRASIYARLQHRGLASQLELLSTQAEADEKRAAAEALRLTIRRLEQEQRTRDSDRAARLAQFHRELTRLDGDIDTAEATLARLANTIDQSRIRAPIAGHLGEVAAWQPGAVLQPGDTLGVVLPASPLQVVASFPPAIALGRIQPGQPARLRLEGFPWAQYGSLAATVTRVADETRNGMVRVEFQLVSQPQMTLSLQHGLPGTVEVEIERLSPAILVLQAVGKRFGVSFQNAMAAEGYEVRP